MQEPLKDGGGYTSHTGQLKTPHLEDAGLVEDRLGVEDGGGQVAALVYRVLDAASKFHAVEATALR